MSRRRIGVWPPIALVALVPFSFDPSGYFIFLPLKSLLVMTLVPAGLAVLIARRRPLARTPSLYAWLVLLTVLVAAALLGVGGITSWIGYPGRGLGVLAWMIFAGALWLGSSLRDDDDRTAVIGAASLGAVVVSVYALLQAAGLDPLEWAANIDVTRTRSTMGNAAFLGAYLSMMFPLSGRIALSSQAPRARALHASAAVLSFAALLSTQTRGAWLGALAGAIVIGVLELPRRREQPHRLGVMLAAAALLLTLLVTVSPFASQIRSVLDVQRATGRGRLTQWALTLDLIADRPVAGWGPDTYAFVFPAYIDEQFERTVGRRVIPDRAHNSFLDVGSAAGVLGIASYAALLIVTAGSFIRGRKRDPVSIGLAGACVAYLMQLQFSFPVTDLDTVFWLLTGMLVASPTTRSLTLGRRWIAVPIAAAVLGCVWGAGDVVADRRLRAALEAEADGDFAHARRHATSAARAAPQRVQYLQAAARLHRRIGEQIRRSQDFDVGLEYVRRAIEIMPRDLEFAMDRADLLLAYGQSLGDQELVDDAADAYEEILAVDRASSRAHLKVGVAYVELDRIDDAERSWLAAARLAPRSPGPLLNLGNLYAQDGRTADAESMFRKALEIDPDNTAARAALDRLRS